MIPSKGQPQKPLLSNHVKLWGATVVSLGARPRLPGRGGLPRLPPQRLGGSRWADGRRPVDANDYGAGALGEVLVEGRLGSRCLGYGVGPAWVSTQSQRRLFTQTFCETASLKSGETGATTDRQVLPCG